MPTNWLRTSCLIFTLANLVECEHLRSRVLSRRKRYLTFPEGSVVSFAVCITSATYFYPPKLFTQNLAWGVEYELPPNGTIPFKEYLAPKLAKRRRNRRDLYEKIETLITTLGYDGRDCILRTLCEASQKFTSKEGNLFHLIYKIIFGYPVQELHPDEPEEHHVYQLATQIGLADQQCIQLYNCPFSLIDVALGYYSQNPT